MKVPMIYGAYSFSYDRIYGDLYIQNKYNEDMRIIVGHFLRMYSTSMIKPTIKIYIFIWFYCLFK